MKDHVESATADQRVRAIWKIIIATKITNPSFMVPRPLSILPNELDGRLKVCFMFATYQNYEALRAAFTTTEIECFIQKPVEIKDLVRRINAELQ